VCRRHGISQPTYYNWKSKYGGVSASELKRIKELEAERSKFKRMDIDLAMESNVLEELIGKNTLRPTEKREAVEWFKEGHRHPVTRACQAVGLSGSGLITGRNSSHSSSSPGVGATEFVFIISSPENPPRALQSLLPSRGPRCPPLRLPQPGSRRRPQPGSSPTTRSVLTPRSEPPANRRTRAAVG
jgi:hypothetical protein